MTARTRFGSTWWRAAACSMAESMLGCAKPWPDSKFGAGRALSVDLLSVDPRRRLTSAAAERAARTLAEGTGFQRCSVTLQNIREFRWMGTCECPEATGTGSLT